MARNIRSSRGKTAPRKTTVPRPAPKRAPRAAKPAEIVEDPYAHLNEQEVPRARAAGRPEQPRLQRASARQAPREESARDDEREPGLRRQRRRAGAADAFRVSPDRIPPGTSYEWKALAHKGLPADEHQVNLRENGWRPVPASRHPELIPDGYAGSSIIRKEMMLMERPQFLTDEARQEDYDLAREQVQIKEQALSDTPAGTFTRHHNSARAVTGVRVTHEPLAIPE